MADPLDNYEMLEELGSGSFGIVYKAREKATDELVAVKHIDLDGTDDDIRDIQQEIALLSTCSSPYVTKYKTSFVRGVKLWIVMEFLGGGSCLDLLKLRPFTEAHVAIVCRELLLGLDYLHTSGKIHRDIKAANILLSHTGKVKIADFGVAAQLTNIKSQRNTFVGTPFWMAPEVIQESGYDFKADIWSLGITTMELIQGEPPNAELHPMKALFHIPKNPPPRLESGRFSRDIRSFVACCLVKDANKRPSARDLLQHRFIQKAGSMDSLRHLIEKCRQVQRTEEDEHHPRFYEETLRDMSRRDVQADDDWVFDTVRPSTAKQPVHTMKKRKLSETLAPAFEPPTEMMQGLNLDPTVDSMEVEMADSSRRAQSPSPPPQATMIRVPRRRQSSVSTSRRVPSPQKNKPLASPSKPSPRKTSSSFSIAQSPTRQSSVIDAPVRSPSKIEHVSPTRRTSTKQPLALDMSFGNSPSSTRPFRRVSSGSHPQSPTLCASPITNENQPPNPPLTKETRLAHRLFTKAIDPSFQELYAHTSGRTAQDAISKAGEAYAALNALDPEGELALFKLMLEKVICDPKLSRALLPMPNTAMQTPVIAQLSRCQSDLLPAMRDVSRNVDVLQSAPVTPQKGAPRTEARRDAQIQISPQKSALSSSPLKTAMAATPAAAGNGSKLLLAQNNPHLKSHKRRQSSVVSLVGGGAGAGKEQEKEAALLPGQARQGMEHSKVVGDRLYERWLEGLRGRWPQV